MQVRKKWQPIPGFLPGKFHGRRTLVNHSPRGCEESDNTERLSMHTRVRHYRKGQYPVLTTIVYASPGGQILSSYAKEH